MAELARLEFLEELTVNGEMASATGLESLLALTHLKQLHILGPDVGSEPTEELILDDGEEVAVFQVEIDRCRRALDALRQANPGIVIDGNDDATDSPEELRVPTEYESPSEASMRESALQQCKKGDRLPSFLWPKPAGGF